MEDVIVGQCKGGVYFSSGSMGSTARGRKGETGDEPGGNSGVQRGMLIPRAEQESTTTTTIKTSVRE
eukprot:CAMPEP_0184683862 /NCGR_PEP_ID=MMETSP0312-20130426/12911_1 /TAXON_ID=31354 /ORGANISM="Compsopogon coeruleus, Strain SAG 36.94" /LENGTH=66 /DNA_ID=CAMNT_0027136533 /DNA_START=276 /DNA_END=476 /DNA_ORIENTATION=-